MSEGDRITLTLTQESDYEFRVRFDDTAIAELVTDEAPPIGHNAGPSPTRLLAAAVGNCLSASLLFALRKYKNAPGKIVTHVGAEIVRNEQGRLRVGRISADIHLAEAGADHAQIDRLLAQFENFCIVTESVRGGIPVDVSVHDATGALLHSSEDAS